MATYDYLNKIGLSHLWEKAKAKFADKLTTETELNKKFELPTGGTVGQVLSKTSSGTEWKNVEIGVDSIPKATSISYGTTKYLDDTTFNLIVDSSARIEIPVMNKLTFGEISTNLSYYQNGHVYISVTIHVPYQKTIKINRNQTIITYESKYGLSGSSTYAAALYIPKASSVTSSYTRNLVTSISSNDEVVVKMENEYTDIDSYVNYTNGVNILLAFDYAVDPLNFIPEHSGDEYATVDQLASLLSPFLTNRSTLWEGSWASSSITVPENFDDYKYYIFTFTGGGSGIATNENYEVVLRKTYYQTGSSNYYLISDLSPIIDSTNSYIMSQISKEGSTLIAKTNDTRVAVTVTQSFGSSVDYTNFTCTKIEGVLI